MTGDNRRAEYFRLRYQALRNKVKKTCPYCKKSFTQKKKLNRCPTCKNKFVKQIYNLYVNEGKTFGEIGVVIDSTRDFSGERIRQIYKEDVPGGFTAEEAQSHENNRVKKKIEEKTGKNIKEIIKEITKNETLFTPRKIAQVFDCSWECGKLAANYLLQWHPESVKDNLMALSKEDYIDFVKIDLENHSF